MNSPPKEEGRTDDAARLETACTAILAQKLKEINSAAPKVWTDEGWRLLDQYQRTGDVRHREAFNRHVAGIRMRLREAVSQ
jgi:hypothetical protein